MRMIQILLRVRVNVKLVPIPLPSPENPAPEAYFFNFGLLVLRFHILFYLSLSHPNSLLILCRRLNVRATLPYASPRSPDPHIVSGNSGRAREKERKRNTLCLGLCSQVRFLFTIPVLSSGFRIHDAPPFPDHLEREIPRGPTRFDHIQPRRGGSGRATTRLYWSRRRSWHLIRRPSTRSLSHASDSK